MLKHCNVRGQYLLHCTTVLHILTYKGSFRLFEFWFCLLANIMIFVLPSVIWNHGCGIYHQWYPRGYLKPPLWNLPSVISSGIFAQVYLCGFPRMNPQPVVSACNSDTGCLLVLKDCVLLMLFPFFVNYLTLLNPACICAYLLALLSVSRLGFFFLKAVNCY